MKTAAQVYKKSKELTILITEKHRPSLKVAEDVIKYWFYDKVSIKPIDFLVNCTFGMCSNFKDDFAKHMTPFEKNKVLGIAFGEENAKEIVKLAESQFNWLSKDVIPNFEKFMN